MNERVTHWSLGASWIPEGQTQWISPEMLKQVPPFLQESPSVAHVEQLPPGTQQSFSQLGTTEVLSQFVCLFVLFGDDLNQVTWSAILIRNVSSHQTQFREHKGEEGQLSVSHNQRFTLLLFVCYRPPLYETISAHAAAPWCHGQQQVPILVAARVRQTSDHKNCVAVVSNKFG